MAIRNVLERIEPPRLLASQSSVTIFSTTRESLVSIAAASTR
jgi:hypothetical protein